MGAKAPPGVTGVVHRRHGGGGRVRPGGDVRDQVGVPCPHDVHTRTHARTHRRMRTRTHTRTQARVPRAHGRALPALLPADPRPLATMPRTSTAGVFSFAITVSGSAHSGPSSANAQNNNKNLQQRRQPGGPTAAHAGAVPMGVRDTRPVRTLAQSPRPRTRRLASASRQRRR